MIIHTVFYLTFCCWNGIRVSQNGSHQKQIYLATTIRPPSFQYFYQRSNISKDRICSTSRKTKSLPMESECILYGYLDNVVTCIRLPLKGQSMVISELKAKKVIEEVSCGNFNIFRETHEKHDMSISGSVSNHKTLFSVFTYGTCEQRKSSCAYNYLLDKNVIGYVFERRILSMIVVFTGLCQIWVYTDMDVTVITTQKHVQSLCTNCALGHTNIQPDNYIFMICTKLLTSCCFSSQFSEYDAKIFKNINGFVSNIHDINRWNMVYIRLVLFSLIPFESFEDIHQFLHIEFKDYLSKVDLSLLLSLSVTTLCVIRVIYQNCLSYVRYKSKMCKCFTYDDCNDKMDFVFRRSKQRNLLTNLHKCNDSSIEEKYDQTSNLLQNLLGNAKQWSREIQLYPVFKSELDHHFESSINDESCNSCNKIELIRVGTFSKFPAENKPWYLGLARAGFFYTGKSDIVECFHCHVRHGNWKIKDDPLEVHKKISPDCEFINCKKSFNIPVPRKGDSKSTKTNENIKDQEVGSQSQTYRRCNDDTKQNTDCLHAASHCVDNQMQKVVTSAETRRPAFDKGHPHRFDHNLQLNGHSTASQGQNKPMSTQTTNGASSRTENEPQRNVEHYTVHTNQNSYRQETKTQNGFIPHTSSNQLFDTTHQNASKTTKTNVPREPISSDLDNNDEPYNTLNQQQLKEPTAKYPQFSSQNVRASTFHGWPATTGQSPWRMAEAGFVYGGYSDYVRCFFCGEGLSEWEHGDDPWVEHAKWFPDCLFVRKNKGDNFIFLVRQSVQSNNGVNSSLPNLEERCEAGLHQHSPSPPPEVHPLDGDESSPAIQSVQEMGYRRDVIETAIAALRSEKKQLNAHNIMEVILSLPASHQDRGQESRLEPPSSRSSQNSSTTIGTVPSLTDTLSNYTSSRTEGSDKSTFSSLLSSPNASNSDNGASCADLGKASSSSRKDSDISSHFQGLSLSDVESMRNENRLLKESRLCKICQDKTSTVVFVPCGHFVCCADCGCNMIKCPVCRQTVENYIKTWT